MKTLFFLPLVMGTAAITSCGTPDGPVEQPATPAADSLSEQRLEAREDSLEFAAAMAAQALIADAVVPDAETGMVRSGHVSDDAADDMAIWVHPTDPARSLIFGTNKKGGVMVFDLDGREMAFHATGRINNIDVLHGFPLGNGTVDLVGCTNRSDRSIDLFRVDPLTGELSDIADGVLPVDTAAVKDVYGFCFYRSKSKGRSYLFVSGKNGTVEQFELRATPAGRIGMSSVRRIPLESQTEGLVADEQRAVLYIGEEDKGVWKLSAEADGGVERTLIAGSGEDNTRIKYDVEGLALYTTANGEGYLLVSSQGNFSYAVFERGGDNRYLGSFKITGANGVDGVEETDGIEAISASLGARYPRGLFLAQDGFNFEGDRPSPQNFKLVSWSRIDTLIQGWKQSPQSAGAASPAAGPAK